MLVVVAMCSLLSAMACASSVELDHSRPSFALQDAQLSNHLRYDDGRVRLSDDVDQRTNSGHDEDDERRYDDNTRLSQQDKDLEVSDYRDASENRQLQKTMVRELLGGQVSKRRHHIFVGKKNSEMGYVRMQAHRYPLEEDASESFSDDSEDEGLQEKRGRMFVGKRWSLKSPDNDDLPPADNVVTSELELQPLSGRQASSMSQKRVRMFVGKKKAPFFVGRR